MIPVPVSLNEGVTTVTTGGRHTCALTTSQRVYCWGINTAGELGNGTLSSSPTPVITGLKFLATQVTAGSSHTCVVTNRRVALCWGYNDQGALGDGTTTNQSLPTIVEGDVYGNVTDISAGTNHTCAIVSGGARCWGQSLSGAIGDGTSDGGLRLKPVSVSGLSTGVTSLSAGFAHTCAIVNKGAKCWGTAYQGQLGYSASPQPYVYSPVDVDGLGSGVISMSAGWNHSCASREYPFISYCWGTLGNSWLGDGSSSAFLKVEVAEPLLGQVKYEVAYATETTATIRWENSVTFEKGFLVYRVEGAKQTLVNCPTTQPDLTTCTDTGLTPGSYYQYYVYAYNVLESTTPGSYILARTGAVNGNPTLSYAFPSGPNSVTVGWTTNTAARDAFKVYRYTPGGWLLEATVPGDQASTTITNPAMDTNTSHTFRLTILRGNEERPANDVIYSASRGTAVGASPPQFTAVENFDTTGAVVRWRDDSTDRAEYLVYRVVGTTSTLLNCGRNDPAARACVDYNTLTPGAIVQYYVYGIQKSGVATSIGSPVVYRALNPLDSPFIQSATPTSPTSIRLKWFGPRNADFHRLLRFDMATGTSTTIATLPANSEGYDVTGLSPSTTYVFTIEAVRTTSTAQLRPATASSDPLYTQTLPAS